LSFRPERYRLEYDAFDRYVRNKPIPLLSLLVLIGKSLLMLLEAGIRYIPGGFGYKLRYWFYKPLLKHLGKGVFIDVGVHISGAANVSIGDMTWIDSYTRIDAMLGSVSIGKRVHIASFSILGAREPIVIEDFVGISAGVKIYSNSEHPRSTKRMSGPMVPEEFKSFFSAPVTLRKDSFVGTNSVLLPGVELGEGCVVGANCVVTRSLQPWTIYAIAPPRAIGARERVNVPDDY
jgi:acetyltransferase-like isoleucine patch superfamily enzyme